MRKSPTNVCFDFIAQRATVDGQPLQLQDKAWRVLVLLATRAPDVVSRDALIAEIWSGNHLVGERGINQALWAIRSELGDDARNPRYIRTLAREGYKWLQEPLVRESRNRRLVSRMSIAASIVVMAITSTTASVDGDQALSLPSRCEPSAKSDVQAYRVDRNLFVDFQNGCRLIVKPSGTKVFGNPMVSDDGKHIAFTVTEEQSCRFVTVALPDGSRTEYDRC